MKKKRSSTKKKPLGSKKQLKNDKHVNNSSKSAINLEDVLSQAESAMEMANIDVALQLFEYAASILKGRVPDDDPSCTFQEGTTIKTTSISCSNITAEYSNTDRKKLASILGKTGELKASIGKLDAARSDFLDAIEILRPKTNQDTTVPLSNSLKYNDDNATKSDGTGVDGIMEHDNLRGSDMCTAENCESVAGLYLYLGQLSNGQEALSSLNSGVNELKSAVNIVENLCTSGSNGNNEDSEIDKMDMELDKKNFENPIGYLDELRRQLCAAYCSIAEVYLTDLCDALDAEVACEEAIQTALSLDEISSSFYSSLSESTKNGKGILAGPPPPDALQTMANFRLSQSRPVDALDFIFKAYDRMKVGCEAMSALVGLSQDSDTADGVGMNDNANEFVEVDAASSLPGYEFRSQTAKILLECASLIESDKDNNESSGMYDAKTKCVESAIQVLGSLMAENDEVSEVWYLLGCAFMGCSPANLDLARYYWGNCMTMLAQIKEEIENSIDEDDEQKANDLKSIERQLVDVRQKLDDVEKSIGEEKEMDDS